MGKVFVVGIAGGSGSGKTTLTNKVAAALAPDVAIITHDSYYRAHHDMTYDERTQLNYDQPDSYETELLVQHLCALLQGEPVERPIYDFSIHDRTDETETVLPAPVIIVEGILLFENPALRALMDLKVFVDASADVRILRRLQRDVRERGRSIESVIDQYLATVRPMHEAYVEPSKRSADLIVPTDGEGSFDVAAEALVNHVRARVYRRG